LVFVTKKAEHLLALSTKLVPPVAFLVGLLTMV